MPIEFTCPNGHALSASEDKAGRTAKCPKCGEKVKIPGSSASFYQDLYGTDSDRSGEQPTPPGMIVFLCPNGHRLNGPAKLQGKAGQCPHCGAKFRIPLQDPEEEAAFQSSSFPDQDELNFPSQEEPSAEPMEWESSDDEYSLKDELPDLTLEDEKPAKAASAAKPSPPPSDEYKVAEVDLGLEGIVPISPLEDAGDDYSAAEPGWATLFPYLWKQKSQGSEVDLYLRDGTKLTPQWFSPSWSLSEQGVFAVRDTEGTYTLLTLAWKAIVRVEVRGVIDLPDGMLK